ncbi:MAG TPA: hypothetical protein VGD05_04865 [Pyrinomonadaceae bacterium]
MKICILYRICPHATGASTPTRVEIERIPEARRTYTRTAGLTNDYAEKSSQIK